MQFSYIDDLFADFFEMLVVCLRQRKKKMSAKFKGFRNNIEKKLGNEFFLFHKKKVPVVFKEEYLKPYYFHDVKVTELLAQLQNAAPKFAVLRNLDKWDQDNFDINR